MVEGFQAAGAFRGALFALHVQREPLLQMLLGPGAIDAVLRLAEASIRPLHRVARRSEQPVVQEHQRLPRVRALQLVQTLTQLLETPYPTPQSLQLLQGRLGLAAAVEQPVHLLHDLAQRSQLGQPARQLVQAFPLRRAEVMPDEQVPMLEQIGHALLLSGSLPRPALLLFAGPATRLLGEFRCHLLAEFRQRVQDRLGDLLQDVERAKLVRDVGPQLLEYLRVKPRTIGGDAAHLQPASLQLSLEPPQESADIVVSRVVVEDSEGQAVVPAVVHDREDAEGTVIDFVDGQVAGEASQRLVEVAAR